MLLQNDFDVVYNNALYTARLSIEQQRLKEEINTSEDNLIEAEVFINYKS